MVQLMQEQSMSAMQLATDRAMVKEAERKTVEVRTLSYDLHDTARAE